MRANYRNGLISLIYIGVTPCTDLKFSEKNRCFDDIRNTTMDSGSTVFAQIIKHAPKRRFQGLVKN